MKEPDGIYNLNRKLAWTSVQCYPTNLVEIARVVPEIYNSITPKDGTPAPIKLFRTRLRDI